MHINGHLVWNSNPYIFNLGSIHLPFPIAIWGTAVAIIIIWFGYSKLTPKTVDYEKQPEPSGWKVWTLVLGALIAGQLLFLVVPSPDIHQIGPLRIRWYGLMWTSAFICGYIIMSHMYKNAGLTQEKLDQLLMYILIATIIGARLGHVIFYQPQMFVNHPVSVFLPFQFQPTFKITGYSGLASHGAAVGILLAMYLYVQKYKNMSFLWLADRVVVVVATGGAFIRVGNFMNSEIVGKPTNLPWGIIFARRTDLAMVPRHPSMLYEAILCLITFGVLWYIYKHYNNNPPEGAMFSTFLVMLFGGRFFLEFFKHHQAHFTTPIFNMGQWLSIPLVAAGIWLITKKVEWQHSDVNYNYKTN